MFRSIYLPTPLATSLTLAEVEPRPRWPGVSLPRALAARLNRDELLEQLVHCLSGELGKQANCNTFGIAGVLDRHLVRIRCLPPARRVRRPRYGLACPDT